MIGFSFSRIFLICAVVLLVSSVLVGVASRYPIETSDNENHIIINDSIRLTPLEMWRQGFGSFRGGEKISIYTLNLENAPINFSIAAYNGTRFSTETSEDITYSFVASAEYYEAVFLAKSDVISNLHFEVTVEKPVILYPFSELSTLARGMFFFSLGSIIILLLKFTFNESSKSALKERKTKILSKKSRRALLILILLSLALWLSLLVVNTNSFASFENWYTDHARHSYSSTLFTKVGFSIFDTPLGQLANGDNSYYKFVTWPHMAYIYPLGGVFLFLPFGFLLQIGVNQLLIFKLEIAFFLLVAHFSLYYFLERFWVQKMFPFLKLLSVYAMYIPLIVYTANGMYDAVPFVFSLFAVDMYLNERYDYFLLFIAISVIFKYQAVLFLFPLIILGLLKLIQQQRLLNLIKNKAIVAATVLIGAAGITAILSAPFLMNTKPEFVMNGINAFNPHAQITWELQSFTVLLTLAVNLLFAIYMLKRNPFFSLSAIFLLLPLLTMPFFQIWYLPFFFCYALLPQRKRDLEATIIWLIFIMALLGFGGISFNPLNVLEGWAKVLGL